MKVQILHNPRCRKSREGLAYLASKKIDYEIVDYLKDSLTKSELKDIIRKTGEPLQNMIREKDDNFKALIKGKNLDNEQIIDLMLQYPKMIQRPVVIHGERAVVAKPPEKIDEIL